MTEDNMDIEQDIDSFDAEISDEALELQGLGSRQPRPTDVGFPTCHALQCR